MVQALSPFIARPCSGAKYLSVDMFDGISSAMLGIRFGSRLAEEAGMVGGLFHGGFSMATLCLQALGQEPGLEARHHVLAEKMAASLMLSNSTSSNWISKLEE